MVFSGSPYFMLLFKAKGLPKNIVSLSPGARSRAFSFLPVSEAYLSASVNRGIYRDYAADLDVAVKNGFGNLFVRKKSPRVSFCEPNSPINRMIA